MIVISEVFAFGCIPLFTSLYAFGVMLIALWQHLLTIRNSASATFQCQTVHIPDTAPIQQK